MCYGGSSTSSFFSFLFFLFFLEFCGQVCVALISAVARSKESFPEPPRMDLFDQ
jgi:hypothetical protein